MLDRERIEAWSGNPPLQVIGGGRGCGRTMRALAFLLDRVCEGADIVYLVHHQRARYYTLRMALDLAAEAKLEPFRPQLAQSRLYVGAGSITVKSLLDRPPVGSRATLVLDHETKCWGHQREFADWMEWARGWAL